MTETNFSDSFVEEMKEVLEHRLRSLREDVSQLEENALSSNKESSGDLSSMPEHSADVGTETYEQNRDIDEIKREQAEIDQIKDALDKIKKEDTEQFGVCEQCEEQIGKERLKAIPYTPHCIECAKASEQTSGG